MNDELELVWGSDNPFKDAGIPNADIELIKADLAAEIVRVLRERDFVEAEAATLAGVQPVEIARIRKADLDRFTIDQMIRILSRLDKRIELKMEVRHFLNVG